jgi:hypothetical protein
MSLSEDTQLANKMPIISGKGKKETPDAKDTGSLVMKKSTEKS